jgi:hypothetical protein
VAEMRALTAAEALRAEQLALEEARKPEPGFKGFMALPTPNV